MGFYMKFAHRIISCQDIAFDLEWEGEIFNIKVSREAIEDLCKLTYPTNKQRLQCFNNHRERILDVAYKEIIKQKRLALDKEIIITTEMFS